MAKFEKGKSGNPVGRPRGKTPRGEFRTAVADVIPEIIDKLKAMARQGDVAAMKLILERTIPPLRPTEEPMAIKLPRDGDLVKSGESVIAAMTEGSITASQAKAAMEVLAGMRGLFEFAEIRDKLEFVEKWLRERSGKH